MKITKKDFLKKIKKLSSLDILSLFAIFFVTASAYFFLSRKTEYLDITLRLFNNDSPEQWLDSNQTKSWYIEQIKIGKTQKGAFGDKLAEIIDVYSYPNGYVYNDVYVTLRLKTSQNKITKQFIYEGNPLLIHDVRSFKIQDLIVSGEIINIGNQKNETAKIKVTFELESRRFGYDIQNNSQAIIKGVENYIADLIRKDLTIVDSKDQELVKITKVIKKPGKISLATINGLKEINDSSRTQVTIETDLLAEKVNNHYYYRKEEPLIVDEKIYLTFDQITVTGKIIKIEI